MNRQQISPIEATASGSMPTRRNLLRGLAGASALALMSPSLRAAVAPACSNRKLWTLMGNFPHTRLFHSGALTSPCVTLDIAPEPVVFRAFARTVAMEFDISELSLVTFLQAKAAGRKLSLMPAVNMSRFQHPYLVYNAEKGPMTPRDLDGARIGVRLFTSTTASWLRGILAGDYGVDVAKMRWLSMQKPNVPEWKDPPNVTMVAEKSLSDMLFAGEVDAIVVDPVPKDPRIKTVIPDAPTAIAAWQKRHNAIQINHMVVVKDELCASDPEAVREAWKLIAQSKAQAGEAAEPAAFTPFGLEANRRNIEVLVDYMFVTKMIPTRYSVDDLFNDVTRKLA